MADYNWNRVLIAIIVIIVILIIILLLCRGSKSNRNHSHKKKCDEKKKESPKRTPPKQTPSKGSSESSPSSSSGSSSSESSSKSHSHSHRRPRPRPRKPEPSSRCPSGNCKDSSMVDPLKNDQPVKAHPVPARRPRQKRTESPVHKPVNKTEVEAPIEREEIMKVRRVEASVQTRPKKMSFMGKNDD